MTLDPAAPVQLTAVPALGEKAAEVFASREIADQFNEFNGPPSLPELRFQKTAPPSKKSTNSMNSMKIWPNATPTEVCVH